jgi:YD repeat-containing protein
MKTVSSLTLVTAICVVIMAPRSASAQCTYRMNDVGRTHGYLSGPCNGAAQSYSGAYPSRASPSNAKWYRRDGSISPNNPSLRTVRQGNTVRVYDGNGQLKTYGFRHGNRATMYDARGRVISRGVYGPNGATIYDARGRFVSSSPDVR